MEITGKNNSSSFCFFSLLLLCRFLCFDAREWRVGRGKSSRRKKVRMRVWAAVCEARVRATNDTTDDTDGNNREKRAPVAATDEPTSPVFLREMADLMVEIYSLP